MITSASNEKVKHLIQLREKGKVRRKEGLFIAEGIRLVRDIPEGDTVELYYSESYEGERAAGKYEVLSDELFKKVSDTETPQGVLAVVRMRKSTSADIINAVKNPMILLLENIQDPGNMGTMFRTAEAAGCSGIIMTEGSADPYSPKVVRSAMGALFRLPFAAVADWDDVFAELGKADVKIFAAALTGAVPYTKAVCTGPSAFLIGNEGNGLREETIGKVTDCGGECIKIPMAGKTESLNAAVSAAVLMYEAARQRGM